MLRWGRGRSSRAARWGRRSASSRKDARNELRAIWRIWSQSSPSAAAVCDVVLADVAAEVRGVVRVDADDQAPLEHPADRVVGEVVEHAELHVRERADGQRHLLRHQPVDQRVVLHAPDAVVDPEDVQHVERLADVLRRPLLPRVRDRQQTLGTGPVVDRRELRRRVARLGRVEPDADDRVAVLQRGLERRHRRVLAQVAQEADDQPRRDAERVPTVRQGARDPVHHRRERDAALGVGLGVEEDLRVAHALVGGRARRYAIVRS